MPGAAAVAGGSHPQYKDGSAAGGDEGDYRVVPFVGRLSGGSVDARSAEAIGQQLQALINWHAQQGWEFHSIAKVSAVFAPGCLGSLFGASTSYMRFDQVIFRRAGRAEP